MLSVSRSSPPLTQEKKETSGGTARAVLRGLLDYPLESLLETRDPAALLCYSCEKTLNSINSISKKLENMKADVRTKGSALHKVQQCGQKRPRSLPGLEVPTRYQPFLHLDPDLHNHPTMILRHYHFMQLQVTVQQQMKQ